MTDLIEIAVKTVFGAGLVVAFAAFAQTLSPKRFAGVFAAAPSVALAGLVVTLVAKGAGDARTSCLGMVAGAIGFVAYGLLAPVLMRRWGAFTGSFAALAGWLVVAAAALGALTGPAQALAASAGAAASGRRPNAERAELSMRASRLRDVEAKQWWIRIAFGGGTSLLAALVSTFAGPFVGGVLLAFPAILLASLTLVASEESNAKSRDDARGATLGALGLVAFAGVGTELFTAAAPALVLVLAVAAWAVVGVGAYFLARALGAGGDEHP